MSTSTGTALTVCAPAKINLTLCIGPRRADGFHDLESVFQAVSLCDRVTLTSLPDGDGIVVTASDATLPCDERNTALRAAVLLCHRYAPGKAARIHLEKHIPSEAGLGGGSSDAAAVLRGLNALWQLDLPREALLPLAATVGSDVPFFLTGGCALVRGRGEVVSPLPDIAPGCFVLVKPAFGVSTARAYADLAARRAGAPVQDCGTASATMCAALRSGEVDAVARALYNDLEEPVIAAHPEIATLRRALLDAGAEGALMSGSGSVVFGLFRSEDAARAGAARLEPNWPWVQVCAPREAEAAWDGNGTVAQ